VHMAILQARAREAGYRLVHFEIRYATVNSGQLVGPAKGII
jgi:hypothetical protein